MFCFFRDGVMVAQEILDLLVWVRALVPEPFFYLGAMVKRLRRRPLKAKSRVRFSLALPGQYVGIPYGPCTREDGTALYKTQDAPVGNVFFVCRKEGKPL